MAGLAGVGVRVRTGGGVRGLQGLVVGQVQVTERPPSSSASLRRVGVGVRGPGAQGGRRGRAGDEARARSRARADHQRTRWLQLAAAGVA